MGAIALRLVGQDKLAYNGKDTVPTAHRQNTLINHRYYTLRIIDLIPRGTGLETTNFHTSMLVSPEALCVVYFRPECAYNTCTRAC